MSTKYLLFLLFPLAIFATPRVTQKLTQPSGQFLGDERCDFQLSICAIFRDEAPHFREWIEFHKLQGVEHFYLYNNNSADAYQQVLQPFIERGEVTLIEWNYEYEPGNLRQWIAIQSNAYMDCIFNYGKTTEWLAALDLDEFLFSPTGKQLPLVLASYREYGGVGANWRMFGTSGVNSLPSGALMIELLTRCNRVNHSCNWRIKSIVRPERVLGCKSAHSFLYKNDFYAVDTDKNKLVGIMSSSHVRYDQLQINHYWTRTETEFINQKIKSRMTQNEKAAELRLKQRAAAYNVDADFSILQFVPVLKMRMDARYEEK